jgi:hypothetical protein
MAGQLHKYVFGTNTQDLGSTLFRSAGDPLAVQLFSSSAGSCTA